MPEVEQGTDLYRSIIAFDHGCEKTNELLRKVWSGTPWVVDVYTGSSSTDEGVVLNQAICEWCRDNIGDEAWPIHGKPGRWHRGAATVHGWTWIGFATEELMRAFLGAFPQEGNADG